MSLVVIKSKEPKMVTFATSICCWASICCCCLVAISCSSDSVSSTRWLPTYTNTRRSRLHILGKEVLMLTPAEASQGQTYSGAAEGAGPRFVTLCWVTLPSYKHRCRVQCGRKKMMCPMSSNIRNHSLLFCLLLTGSWLDILFPLKWERLRWHTVELKFPWKHHRAASSHKSWICIPSVICLSGDLW